MKLRDGSPGQADGNKKGKCWTEGVLRCMATGLTATLRRLSLSALMLPLGAEDATEFSLQHTGATYGAGTTKVEVQWDHTS